MFKALDPMVNNNYLKQGTILKGENLEYRVESVLGSGGFGITYKVSTEIKKGGVLTKFYFAIKEYFVKDWCGRKENSTEMFYADSLAKDVEAGKADFISEARRLIQLRHRNIMRVHEVFEAHNTAYYVMDYVKGSNLREIVLNKGKMSPEEMFGWSVEILGAVDYLHRNNIAHFDIKPSNIMMKQSGKRGIYPILIDFGQSKHYDENGKATSTIRARGCTDGYAPIEQYVGVDDFNPQADIYAIGASIAFCLTAKTPPKSINIEEDDLENLLPNTVDESLRQIVYNSMQRERSKRTQSISIMRHDLKKWHDNVNEEKHLQKGLSMVDIVTPKVKRNSIEPNGNRTKWVWVIICAIIVAILSGVIVWTKQNKKTKRKTSSTPLVENVVKPNNKSIKYVKFG